MEATSFKEYKEYKDKLIKKAKTNPPMKLENTIYKMWECPNCCHDIDINEDGVCDFCGQKYLKMEY